MRKAILVATTAAMLSVAVAGTSHGKNHATTLKSVNQHGKKRMAAKHGHFSRGPKKVAKAATKPLGGLLNKVAPVLKAKGVDITNPAVKAASRQMALQQLGSGPGSGPNQGGSFAGGSGPNQGGSGPQQGGSFTGGSGPNQGGSGPNQGGSGPNQGGSGPNQGGSGPNQGGSFTGGSGPNQGGSFAGGSGPNQGGSGPQQGGSYAGGSGPNQGGSFNGPKDGGSYMMSGGDDFNGGQKARPDDGPNFFDEEREKNRPSYCNSTSYYGALEARYLEACGRTDFSFATRQFKTLEKANQAFDNFCTSECAGAMNAIMAYTDGYVCLSDEMPVELSIISAMCQFDSVDTTSRCGAKLAVDGVFQDRCERGDLYRDQRACENEPECTWNNDKDDSDFRTCGRKVSPAYYESLCNDCTSKLLSVFSPTLNLCTKLNGEFCMVKFAEANQRFTSADPYAAYDNLCASDATTVSCVQWINAGDGSILQARENYRDCIDSTARYAWRTPKDCLAQFNRDYQRAQAKALVEDNICARNATNGQLCASQRQTLKYNQFGSCSAEAFNSFATAEGACPTLSAGCDAKAATQKVLDALGCCTAFRAFEPSTPASAVPSVYKDDTLFTAAEKAAALQAGAETSQYTNFSDIIRCSTATKYDYANDATCTVVNANAAPTEIGSWNTVISAAAVANATLADELSVRLAHDAARYMGNRAINVVVALSAGTNGGTKATFSLKGNTAAVELAKSLWAQIGPFPVVSQTDKFFNEDEKCPGCKADPKDFSAVTENRVFDLIPGAPEDKCTTDTYITAYRGLLEACSNTEIDRIFELEAVTIADANAAWESACTSACLTKFREIRATDAGVCLPPEILSIGDLINVGCSQDAESSGRCGAVLSVMNGVECSYLGEAACNASSSRCVWTPERQFTNKVEEAQCRDQYAEEFLAPICDSGCITKLAATLGGNKDGFAKEARLMDTMFCSVDYDTNGNPKRCLPHIQNDINKVDENEGFFPDAVVSDFCETDRSKLRCAKRIYSAVANDIIHTAEYAFYDCVESVLDNSQVDAYGKVAYIDQYCIENVLAPILSSVDQTRSTLNNMCTKNSNGAYCLSFVNKYRTNSCLGKMIDNYECNTACGSEIKGIFTEMGCCVGNIQQIYGSVPFANLPEEDLPEFETFDEQLPSDDFESFEKWTSTDGTNYYSSAASGVTTVRRQGPPQGGSGPNQGGSGPNQGGSGPQQGGSGPNQGGSFTGGSGPNQGGSGPNQGGSGPNQGGSGPNQVGSGPQQGGSGPNQGGSGPNQGGSYMMSGSAPPTPAPSRQTKGVIGTGKNGANAGDGEELIVEDFAKFGFFSNYMFCPDVTDNELDNLLYKKCQKPRTSTSIERTLTIGASKDTLASTSKKEKRFTKKLLGDLANRQGGSSEEYPSTSLNSDDSGRRQSSSTSVSFSYQGETEEDNQAAATSYDKAVESGSLTLSSTVTLVKNECSNCTTGGDATGVVTTATSSTLTSEFAPTPTPTPAPTEGAAAASTVLVAGIVAMLSALLL